jgi:hypothetical protein
VNIEIGLTGRTVVGSVLDVNKKHLEEKLQEYDPLLYLKWNGSKTWDPIGQKGIKQGEWNDVTDQYIPSRGQGVWEVRRKPETKSRVYWGQYQGHSLSSVEYVENGFISHIMDVEALGYNLVDYMKSIDTWGQDDWVQNLEDNAKAYGDKIRKKSQEDLRYNIKQHKKQFQEWKALLASGQSPYRVVNNMGRK